MPAGIEAAAAISSATIEGAVPGSQEILFAPEALAGGTHTFDIGSAGSTTLVAQTLLPALVTAGLALAAGLFAAAPYSPLEWAALIAEREYRR